MTSAQSVFDFVRALPEFMVHEESYLRNLQEKRKTHSEVMIDMVDFEAASMGLLEQNILTQLMYNYQFTSTGFMSGHDVGFYVLAMPFSDNYDSSIKICFETECTKKMSPNKLQVMQLSGDSINPHSDLEFLEKSVAYCRSFCGIGYGNLTEACYTERFASPTDMRHMLLKAYLYLCDYNLATTSNITQGRKSPVTQFEYLCDSNFKRMSAIMNYDVVIDSFLFSDNELALINLIGNAYPRVKYGKDNVYNTMMLTKDNLAILTFDEKKPLDKVYFKSPGDMCITIYNIAMKLGVLGQLREVIKAMRGVPALLDDIAKTMGDRHFTLIYPKSKCYRAALGKVYRWPEKISRMSNYYGASVSLVADALIAEGLKYDVFSMLEDMAALGPVGLPSGDPVNDKLFNSMQRDYGLSHDDDLKNSLKSSWLMNTNSRLPFSTSTSLKAYTTQKLLKLKEQDMDGAGLFYGPMGYFVGASNFVNSCWGMMSGWSPVDIIPVKDKNKLKQTNTACAYSMGMTTLVPVIANNALGIHYATHQNSHNHYYNLGCPTSGHYKIAKVKIHPVESNVRPKNDYMMMKEIMTRIRGKGAISRVVLDTEDELQGVLKFSCQK